ncbi:MAG: class I SAM-dependent methyltransferase [Candidatus Aminicenantes bacterium]|nr:class I SAM-dependent methyltransferase [Candidatus Aminicenantes bacterium]
MFKRISIFATLLSCAWPAASALQLGSKPAKEWIESMERPERLAKLKTDEVMARLELKPGDLVADVGAGSGVFSWPLAQAVAPGGTVYAVEVDQGFLDFIREVAQQRGADNVVPVLGEFTDPKLPVRNLDLAFFHNVLHHIEGRPAYLETLSGYLKPNARIAIIDLVEGHKEPEMQMNLDQVKEWMAGIGFEMTAEYPLFEDRFFTVFSRVTAP